MVILVVKSLVPHEKAPEAGKKWLEVTKKFPPDRSVSKQLFVAMRPSVKGFIILGAWEVKDGKEKEALIRMNESMLMFTEVEGYKYKIETWSTIEEEYSSIGQTPPG